VRSLRQVLAIDPGLDLDRVVAIRLDLARAGYTFEERERFYREAQGALQRLPAVERATMVHFSPFSGMAYGVPWELVGVPDPGFREGPYLNLAAPEYFALVGTRVIAGREFMAEDAFGEPTAVINERMARALAPDGRAVGLCVSFREQVEEGGCTRIVGVVRNYRHRYLEEANVPMVFLPRDRNPQAIAWGGPSLVVRTRGEAAGAAASVRAAVQALRSDLPYVTVRPLQESVRNDILPYRLGATLFALFGALALVLTAVGLYGVLGYFVTERTPEIGIRRSLGAPRGAVVRLVLRQCLLPVGAGVLVGLAAAWGGTRFITSLLFGVQAQDPAAFVAAAGFLLAVACLATLFPALRASRVDPMIALRDD
jgi:predicted permease